MKKRFIPMLTALMVLAMGTSVFAASPSTSTVVKPAEQVVEVADVATQSAADYVQAAAGTTATVNGVEVTPVIEAVSEATVAATVAEVKAQLNDVANIANVIKSDELKAAATDSNKKIVPTLKTVVEVSAPMGVIVNAQNPITLTFPVVGATANSNFIILHWNGTAWETIVPTVGNGFVSGTFTSLSPVAIVELEVEDTKADADKPADKPATEDDKVSPPTADVATALPAVALLCAAGIVVCLKKRTANI